MPDVMLRHGDWVIVCDGAKALIFENQGQPQKPQLKLREAHEQRNLPSHEQGTDAPGRFVNTGDSGNRSAMEPPNYHDRVEREFLTILLRRLDGAVMSGETRSLVLVAPPRALGVLRAVCPNTLKAAISAEVAKDLVKMPVPEIERHLSR